MSFYTILSLFFNHFMIRCVSIELVLSTQSDIIQLLLKMEELVEEGKENLVLFKTKFLKYSCIYTFFTEYASNLTASECNSVQ